MKWIGSTATALLVAFAASAGHASADILESPNACAVPADVQGQGAAYEPGMDIHGRAILPADLAAPRLTGELRVPAEVPSITLNGVLLKFLLGEFRVDLESGAVVTTGNLAGITEPAPSDCPLPRR